MLISKDDFLSTYKNKKAGEIAASNFENALPLKLDSNISKLISYITFDGHLASDLTNLFLSSKDKAFLTGFARFLEEKFGLIGRFEECEEGYSKTHKYRVFNKPFCRLLELAGAPKGNKSINEFDVPKWVMKNKRYSKAYLKTAFDCEGSIWRDSNGYPRIRFKIHKSERILSNGEKFMMSLKCMLSLFGIETTEIWTLKGYEKGDVKTKGLCFSIKTKSFKTFLKHINFTIKEKRKRMKKAVSSPRCGTSLDSNACTKS